MGHGLGVAAQSVRSRFRFPLYQLNGLATLLHVHCVWGFVFFLVKKKNQKRNHSNHSTPKKIHHITQISAPHSGNKEDRES
jgi:hypothetical protein